MEPLRKMAIENKFLSVLLLLLVLAGAGILLAGRLFNEPEVYIRQAFDREPPETAAVFFEDAPELFATERELEGRLEEFFSQVEGAGVVRVMVSPLRGAETVFATDTTVSRAHTSEEDGQGGSREISNYNQTEKTVILNRQGTSEPLVTRQIEPRIEGIVIIAEGGDNPLVRDSLTRAARTVLGVDAHMVQVLTLQI